MTRAAWNARGALVLGASLQVDAYHNALNGGFDHDWATPGLSVTGDRDIGSVTVSASVRADRHPEAGLQVTERLALLLRSAKGRDRVRGPDLVARGYPRP